ncbi:hypothetical protein J5N97_029116 [Dioscorea zingiberensis]|uniref:Uncharacterized protein n=1 Tax=Dioscorea zingiberensis TaxID=325984 RepID=A0A9D5H5C2_9LILI|nr:hypothetical protein J5N97_029116 [Dioscorea zingiberensis]
MEYVLSMLRRGVSQEVERHCLAPFSCLANPHQDNHSISNHIQYTQFYKQIVEEKLPVQVKKRMARKWQIAAALGRRRISPEKTDASSDSEACTPTTTSVAHKGHFIVYTSDGKRFMVPLEYLDTRIFQQLLRMSEEEYGLPGDGPITLHCDAVSMEYILLLLKKQVSKDVEKALLSSILVPHQSSCSALAIVHDQQIALCSF